ncbi:molybdopterin-dependent oxidoreductase [Arthrobacter sp. NIO-1057]|uniref:molybdopterin-dependent oxidoreductase n=1 Tax=Arthrobacter sp. NIO-1057 TaxID=993071 RepID=UPI00071C4700|nr:molybdopterin-dependent oxidoreductase [Arthrobacter sp. NIO-1057]KSU66810.1 oxidoreductase [Arthrobacter sp. NIO-1057]
MFAVAQLASAFFNSASSPFFALGSAIIDLTPPWLKDFAIATFGTNDKLALFISIGVAASVLSALIGLLAKRSFALACSAIIALALVLASAVAARASTSLLDVVPTVLGAVAGIGSLHWLARLATTTVPEPDQGTATASPSRRIFLRGAALSLAAAALATAVSTSVSATRNMAVAARNALRLPAARTKAKALPEGVQIEEANMPRFITPNRDFYRIDTALSVPQIDPNQWSLRVHGMVENEFTMGFDELLGEELVETYLTLTCVSNPVGGDLVGNAKWLGYPLRKVLARAVPQAGADMVLSTSHDGFSASTPLQALTDDRMALLAIGMNGEPLPFEHGFPVRMVVPGLYGYVSATKWVVDLEVTRFQDKAAYWTTRGWSERGPIKMSSRIDTPRPFAEVPAGEVVLGGSAWAQTRGISRVQVQIDDGPWEDAQLAAEASLDTWRQWRFVWKDAAPGRHTASVRAYDAQGKLQTGEKANPVPNGASGWQRLQFTVQ